MIFHDLRFLPSIVFYVQKIIKEYQRVSILLNPQNHIFLLNRSSQSSDKVKSVIQLLGVCIKILKTHFILLGFSISSLIACSHQVRMPSSLSTDYHLSKEAGYLETQKLINENLSSKGKNKSTEETNALLIKKQDDLLIAAIDIETREKVLSSIHRIKDTQSTMVAINEENLSSNELVILVHGLYFENFGTEFLRPLIYLNQNKVNSYFFKWSNHKKMEDNASDFTKHILSLSQKYPEKKINIFSYCAGGIVTLFSMNQLLKTPEVYNRIQFHTVATPLHGYGAPKMAQVGIPIWGHSTITIGRGALQFLNKKTFESCQQWVNSNCELDKHACESKGVLPQMGPVHLDDKINICLNSKMIIFNNENHLSILNKVFFEIFKD